MALIPSEDILIAANANNDIMTVVLNITPIMISISDHLQSFDQIVKNDIIHLEPTCIKALA